MIPVPRSLTYRLDLEYDGTEFSGWQFQEGERTVQGCLEEAVSILFETHTRISSAGRTDAGVHASAQVASFDSICERPVHSLHRALNNHLPPDIRVSKCTIAMPGFHARFSARWRGYEYIIAKRPRAINRNNCWYYAKPLDTALMQAAALNLLGSHDFRSFAHANPLEPHYLSDVYLVEWTEDVDYYRFKIQANRFLHGMVRLLVGTFVMIGRGKIAPEQLLEIKAAKDNRKAGQKAPPCGLTLVQVGYNNWPEL